jgi:hypothetical protein
VRAIQLARGARSHFRNGTSGSESWQLAVGSWQLAVESEQANRSPEVEVKLKGCLGEAVFLLGLPSWAA